MTALFGAHGLAATLKADAARGMLERMGQRAGIAAIPLPSIPISSFIGTDGVAFGASQRCRPGEDAEQVFVQAPQLWLAMKGRLDDRAALAQQLELPNLQSSWAIDGLNPPPSDAALVMAAYERFGADCVQHFFGDWVFALWDARQKRLLLARDATGNSALFWWQGGGQLLFASSLPTLLAAGPVPARPDRRWLAGLLTVFTDPAFPGATAFEDVHSLPPGHLLIAERGDVKLQRWWWPEKLAPLDDAPLPELEARFLALYDDAVRQRLRRSHGAVAAMLSGGLDSGSVVALAAPAMAATGQRLAAFVHVPGYEADNTHPDRTTDEWPLAQATARHVGHVDLVACRSLQDTPLGAMRRWLDMAAYPTHAAGHWYWIMDILQHAHEAGASVLLTGQGGNATVSFAGSGDLRPQLAALQFGQVGQALWQDNTGLYTAIQRRLLKPAFRPAWHWLKRTALQGRRPASLHDYGLLNPALADELTLHAAMEHAGHDRTFISASQQKVALWRLGLNRWADGPTAHWAQLSMQFDVEARDPTRDRRLVEFCARLPDALYWARGQQRGLVRHTMRNHLPEAVLSSNRKGLQSADLRARLLASKEDLLAQVDAVSRHAQVRAWLDVPRLQRSALAAVAAGSPSTDDHVSPNHMLRGLMTAMFIARHA